jgi:protein TonB
MNPAPRYPSDARLRNQQGTVLLRVLVAADGSVERIELGQSSGFDSLDQAAIETVRDSWRFVPAENDGAKLESWVIVPIRFSLEQARSSNF